MTASYVYTDTGGYGSYVQIVIIRRSKMTLNKRYLRNIKENLSFYIASSVLTVVALLLFYLFYIAGSGIKKYGD